jgi:hypothetical protein
MKSACKVSGGHQYHAIVSGHFAGFGQDQRAVGVLVMGHRGKAGGLDAGQPSAKQQLRLFLPATSLTITFSCCKDRQAGAPENPDSAGAQAGGFDGEDRDGAARTEPYRRVEAYLADFRYDPEKRPFTTWRDWQIKISS